MEIDGQGATSTIYVNNLYEKVKPDDLAKAMRSIFGQFGNIIDVVSRRTYKLRGQAWVVFEKPEDARAALETMQGFPFFNKPIKIAFAKTKSDATKKLEKVYDEEEVEARRQQRRAAWEARAAAALPQDTHAVTAPVSVAKKTNTTLLVENVPNEVNEGILLLVFQRFAGLKEVRMAKDTPGMAYVEYDNESGAQSALHGLQGFKLATDKPMKLSVYLE